MKQDLSEEVDPDIEIVMRLLDDDAYYARRAFRYESESFRRHLAVFILPLIAGTLVCVSGLTLAQWARLINPLIDHVSEWSNRDSYLIWTGAIAALLALIVAVVLAASLRLWLIRKANGRLFQGKVIDNFLYLKRVGLHPPDTLLIDADGIVEMFENDEQPIELRIELARVFGVFQGLMEQNPIVAFWTTEAMREALNAHYTISKIKSGSTLTKLP